MSSGTLSLVRKLSEVMASVSHVEKSGRNDHFKYDYATEADIVASVRGEMAKRHLMMLPNVTRTTVAEVARKNGGADRLVTLEVCFTVADGDSGETMTVTSVGEGQDAGDKAAYKAMTGATKYAILKLFLIPTGDDPEADDAPPQRAAPKQQPRPAATPLSDRIKRAVDGAILYGCATKATVPAWVQAVLGAPKKSTELTAIDVAKLEASVDDAKISGKTDSLPHS